MRLTTAALLVTLALTVGCAARTVSAPQLGLGPFRPGDASIYEDAVRAAMATGHPPTSTDPQRGRFTVLALSDPYREIRFVVQCHADGWITVSPEGAGVEHVGSTYRLRNAVRAEYQDLVLGLERGVAVWDR